MFQVGTILKHFHVAGTVLLFLFFDLKEVQSQSYINTPTDLCGGCAEGCVELEFEISLDDNPTDNLVVVSDMTNGVGVWTESYGIEDARSTKRYTNTVCSNICYLFQVYDNSQDGLSDGFDGGFTLLYDDNYNACFGDAAFSEKRLYTSTCTDDYDPSEITTCPSQSDAPSDPPSKLQSDAPTIVPSGMPSFSPSSVPNTDEKNECFSGEMKVFVQDKGSVKMEVLQVGDYVKSGNGGTYERIYAFAHRVPKKHTKFLQFHTTVGAPLEMTGGHLVFLKGKINPVRADSIRVGDCLEAESSNVVVEKITLVSRNGIYNPLTSTGTIQVNGITASAFVSFQKENNEYVELKGGIGQLLSHHDLAHRAITPFWFYCTTLAFCYEANNGLPVYVSKGMELIEWSQQQHIALQILMWVSFRMLLLASILMMSLTMVIPATLISGISTFHLQQFVSLPSKETSSQTMK